MSAGIKANFYGIAIIAVVFCSVAFAETVVYKWVDEDGVVHFSETPPEDSVEADTLVIPKAPPAPAAPSASTPVAANPVVETEPVKKTVEQPARFVKTDISKLSVAELDLRCEEAREQMIAPLREAEIENCKQNKREDPAYCERFNADFGDGGRTVNGTFRPRMFDDLPECVEAMEEARKRGR